MRLLFIIILFIFSAVAAQPVYFNHLGVKDGLAQLSVYAIYQDQLGRMWFGTQEGISLYNGERVTSYKNYSQLLNMPISSYLVKSITGTDEGDVFFTLGNILVWHDLKKDSFCALKKNVGFLQKMQDKVYFSTSDSIFYWDSFDKKITFLQTTKEKNNITSICLDQQKRLWVGTDKGLYLIAGQDAGEQCIIPEKDISVLFESSTHDIWIGTRLNGLYRYDVDGKLTEYAPDNDSNSISHKYIRSIIEDNSGNLWIGTFYGLNKYDPKTNHFSFYRKDHLRGSLSHSSILSLFIDKQKILWVGTYYGGVNYFNSRKNLFNFYSDDPLRKECLNFPFIGQMVEDNDSNLWICTDGGGLNMLDRKTGLFSYYTANNTGNSIKHNNLKCIDYDPEENQLYIGTYTGGLCRLDIDTHRFYNYIDKTPASSKVHANISWLKVYKDHVIFVDDYGLFKLEKETGDITPLFSGADQRSFFGNQFIIDSKDNLWLAHFSGVTRIHLKEPSTRQTFNIGKSGLGAASISFIAEASGKIYITTAGEGIFLYNEDNNNFSNYNAGKEQLLSDFCYSIAESRNGNLIVSCNKGLSILNPTTGEQIFSATIEKDLPFSAINSGCGIYRCSNNEIFVGSADGMISFWENDITWFDKNYHLYFSNLAVNHKTINPSDHGGILAVIPAYTRHLTLSHDQNNLIFSFASSNYLKSNNSSVYEYKLEGFDPEWIPTHSTHLNYTNLSPGSYTLRVREKNMDNSESKEIHMAVTILQPFYNTPFAWIVYILLFISLLYIFLLIRQRQIKLKTSLEYERKEKDYITNLNKAKIAFFTNVSHEFRTPLSLIISQIEILLNSNAISFSIRNQINKVYKTTFQLQSLINELLDFQKMEQKQTRLRVSRLDLVSFLRTIFTLFEEKALSKQIRYTFSSQHDTIYCWFDPKQLQKAISNILSNAFKFTPDQGSIDLFVDEKDGKIMIKVIDSGMGIDNKDLSAIFEQYYQASNSIISSSKEFSTGLGLPLCKDIVDLHHGTIQVESKLNYGSIFIITLLSGKAHFENDINISIDEATGQEDVVSSYVPADSLSIDDQHELETHLLQKEDESLYKILIVEDNSDLQEALCTIFAPFYHVLQADDGVEGLRIAREEQPDIIVSDIMMPEMYGDQMCFELKQDIATCHIPIILLTALSSVENNIDGLLKGADDYITKPFNTKILLVKCNNLIRNRLLQQQRYQQEPASTIQLLANNETDKKFLKKVESVIESHLNDTEFSIERLAEEVAISRRSLFSKFKQLTGMTPNDFILNYKLKKAAFLLKNNSDLQIGEIADMLGFSSPRYFSRCFKNQFSVSPMEYRGSRG